MVGINFLKDESAVEGLPLRIVIAIILFSVILALCAKTLSNFIGDMNEKKLTGELDVIEKNAAAMYMNGGARDINNPLDFPGTVENIHVNIPDNAAFVVFGAMPQADGNPPATRETHADNVYYYVLDDGRVQSISSIARFSANGTDLDRPVVLYPGEYEITLELVRNGNGTYVTIDYSK